MNKWIKLGVVGIAMLGLTGCDSTPKKVTIDKKYSYTAYENSKKEDGYYNTVWMAMVAHGKTSPNAKVEAKSKYANYDKHATADKNGNFKIVLPEEQDYTIVAYNGKKKSKPIKLSLGTAPKKYDTYLKLDNENKQNQEVKMKMGNNGKATVSGTTTPGAKITVENEGKVIKKFTSKTKRFSFTIKSSPKLNYYKLVVNAQKGNMREDYRDVFIDNAEFWKDPDATPLAGSDVKVEPYNKVAYDELNRNPDKYDSKKLEITGDVIQTIEDDDDSSANGALVAMDGNTDNVVMVVYGKDDTANGERILEDDNVTVQGIGAKTFSYNAESGDRVTVPAVSASNITRN